MPSSCGEREMCCATAAVQLFFPLFFNGSSQCPSTVEESIIVLRNTILRGCGSGDAF